MDKNIAMDKHGPKYGILYVKHYILNAGATAGHYVIFIILSWKGGELDVGTPPFQMCRNWQNLPKTDTVQAQASITSPSALKAG